MGVRMYSPQIGRFLSVDPLHEFMPGQNSYHYAFNSPLIFKDPSGLVPQKEKNREKLQAVVLPDVDQMCYVNKHNIQEFIDEIAVFAAMSESILYSQDREKRKTEKAKMVGIGGGGSGGSRAKKSDGSDGNGNNGTTATWGMRFKADGTIERTLDIKDKDGNVRQFDIDVEMLDKPDDLTQSEYLEKIIDGFQKIVSVDPNFFSFENVGRIDNISIISKSEIAIYYNHDNGTNYSSLIGLHSYDESECSATIYICSEQFSTQYQPDLYYENTMTTLFGSAFTTRWQPYAAIAHEFGHNMDLIRYGYNIFNSWSRDKQEDSANSRANYFRGQYGDPIGKLSQ
jgi:hypothetical protein